MPVSIRRALLLLASLLALTTALAPGGGSAQYPTPIGSITPTGPTSVEADSVIQIVCTLLDTNGDAVPNQPVVFRIDENPGTANLLTASPQTDADGNAFADLYVGSTPGASHSVMRARRHGSTVHRAGATSAFVRERRAACSAAGPGRGGHQHQAADELPLRHSRPQRHLYGPRRDRD